MQFQGLKAQRNSLRTEPCGATLMPAGEQDAARTSPLLTVVSALLFLVRSVVEYQITRAENFLYLSSHSKNDMDLADVLRFAPCTVMKKGLDISKCAAMYQAALLKLPSKFDVITSEKSATQFLRTLYESVNVSPAVFIIALMYVERLLANVPELFLCKANFRKLYGVAFMLAAKWHEDCCHPTAFYADLLQVSLEELNELESYFLEEVSYSLFVSSEDLRKAQHSIIVVALQSPERLAILESLTLSRVSELEEVLNETGTSSVINYIFKTSMEELWIPSIGLVGKSREQSDQLLCQGDLTDSISPFLYRSALTAVARIQFEHDLLSYYNECSWGKRPIEVYIECSPSRFSTLQQILLGESHFSLLTSLNKLNVAGFNPLPFSHQSANFHTSALVSQKAIPVSTNGLSDYSGIWSDGNRCSNFSGETCNNKFPDIPAPYTNVDIGGLDMSRAAVHTRDSGDRSLLRHGTAIPLYLNSGIW